jgi:hypothetical protein
MLVPVIMLKSSPPTCIELPVPELAKLNLPGLAFARAMNCGTLSAATDGWTTSMFGSVATSEIGAKSLTVS